MEEQFESYVETGDDGEEKVVKDPFSYSVNFQLAIEKIRVSTQVRNTHLKKNGRADPFCQEAHKKLAALEEWIDGEVASKLVAHPAFPWFNRVKGVGFENIGKVVGLIDITKASYVSSLWKYAGFSVEDGKAPKQKKGEVREFNLQLRSMCWRLGTSLMRAKGKYYDFYQEKKVADIAKIQQRGITILPQEELDRLKKKKNFDPTVYMSEGHVHGRALRKAIKLFLSHLWVVWREAEGLTIAKPYAHAELGHQHYIDPWDFAEQKLKKSKKVA